MSRKVVSEVRHRQASSNLMSSIVYGPQTTLIHSFPPFCWFYESISSTCLYVELEATPLLQLDSWLSVTLRSTNSWTMDRVETITNENSNRPPSQSNPRQLVRVDGSWLLNPWGYINKDRRRRLSHGGTGQSSAVPHLHCFHQRPRAVQLLCIVELPVSKIRHQACVQPCRIQCHVPWTAAQHERHGM